MKPLAGIELLSISPWKSIMDGKHIADELRQNQKLWISAAFGTEIVPDDSADGYFEIAVLTLTHDEHNDEAMSELIDGWDCDHADYAATIDDKVETRIVWHIN